MATILVVDVDQQHAEKLNSALRRRGHRVVNTDRKNAVAIKESECQSDLVVFNISRTDNDVWQALRHVCNLRRTDGLPVLVLCYSKIYRGPRFELEVERLGARFAYEG
jgi:DNA-binding response OmpR family regulator